MILFEIIMLGLFYTFGTKKGNEVSLTDSHNISVFISEINQIEYLRASEVTLKHHLIMLSGKIEIENISINSHQGFYSPLLTLTGYLFVNNISILDFSVRYLFKLIFANLNYH